MQGPLAKLPGTLAGDPTSQHFHGGARLGTEKYLYVSGRVSSIDSYYVRRRP